MPAGFRKIGINSPDLVRIAAEFRKFRQNVVEAATGFLTHGVMHHLRPFVLEHRFDIVFQGLAEGLGIGQISGGVVGGYDGVGFLVDVGLGSQECRPQSDDGKADEKGVEGGEKIKDGCMEIFLVFQAMSDPAANQHHTPGNQGANDEDQEKYDEEIQPSFSHGLTAYLIGPGYAGQVSITAKTTIFFALLSNGNFKEYEVLKQVVVISPQRSPA